MIFEVENVIFNTKETITDTDAPTWLTSEDTVKGSTMDYRHFWTDYILKLEVGGVFHTDFHIITRKE